MRLKTAHKRKIQYRTNRRRHVKTIRFAFKRLSRAIKQTTKGYLTLAEATERLRVSFTGMFNAIAEDLKHDFAGQNDISPVGSTEK